MLVKKATQSQSLQVSKSNNTIVLLVQLGTPDEATPKAVRRYLKEFLSDPHVVDINRLLWFIILNGIILTFRPNKSALLYQRLFKTYGPVLYTYTKSLTEKLKSVCAVDYPNIQFEFAMRYGNPNLQSVLHKLNQNENVQNLLVVPLFPQFSNTTTGSIIDKIQEVTQKFSQSPNVYFIKNFHNDHRFIQSISHQIQKALNERKQPPEKLILSYHGIPQRYADRGDPYPKLCEETTHLISQNIKFSKENIIHTYQSRFGKEPWLQPYTDETLANLAKQGIKDVMIACPAFTMDCLETLDEIGIESQKYFKEHGGKRLQLISCLNDSDDWALALKDMIIEKLKDI